MNNYLKSLIKDKTEYTKLDNIDNPEFELLCEKTYILTPKKINDKITKLLNIKLPS